MKFSETISNQSTFGCFRSTWSKCSARRPTPRPRSSKPKRERFMIVPGRTAGGPDHGVRSARSYARRRSSAALAAVGALAGVALGAALHAGRAAALALAGVLALAAVVAARAAV